MQLAENNQGEKEVGQISVDVKLTISLNPALYKVVEFLARIYYQTQEDLVVESLVYDINCQLCNHQDDIGSKTAARLLGDLGEAGIDTW